MKQHSNRSWLKRTSMAAMAGGLLVAVVGVMANTASADKPVDDGVPADCPAMFNGSPDEQLDISSDPAAGTEVAERDTIETTLEWPTEAWSDVSKVYVCVQVDDVVVGELTFVEKPGENDGTQDHSFDVPVGAKEVCVVGRVSGTPTQLNTSDSTHKSNTLCWTVGTPDTPDTPDEECVAPLVFTDLNGNGIVDSQDECTEVQSEVIIKPTDPGAPQTGGTKVLGEQVVRPVVAAQELPRTGSTTLPLIQVGLGLMLMGAGALIIGKDQTASI